MALTTSKDFPVIDVTHKPKRYQSDNIKNAVNNDSAVKMTINNTEEIVADSLPTLLTLENAIHFFSDNAVGAQKDLFNQTALWLTDYLKIRKVSDIDD